MTGEREIMARRGGELRDSGRVVVVVVVIACFLSAATRTTEAGRTSAQKAPQPERMALWIDGKQIERFAGKQSLFFASLFRACMPLICGSLVAACKVCERFLSLHCSDRISRETRYPSYSCHLNRVKQGTCCNWTICQNQCLF